MTPETKKQFLQFQINEITAYHIYKHLADLQKNKNNKTILAELSEEEFGHYQLLKKYTGKLPAPKMRKVYTYTWIARLFGLTFSIKFMEKEEKLAQKAYDKHPALKELQQIAQEEEVHETKLIKLIDEDGLNYIGSVVLGLNDALVEFTGALAGYTFALQHSKLVALTGAITGIAAALSMAASEYLSTKAEKNPSKNALKAAIYTGIAYIITVTILILPFVMLPNVYWGLGICLAGALAIIAIFNYYYSVVKTESFKHRFVEMVSISLGIATISFFIGYILRKVTGIEL